MSVSWTLVQFLCTRPSVANPKEELEGEKEKRGISEDGHRHGGGDMRDGYKA